MPNRICSIALAACSLTALAQLPAPTQTSIDEAVRKAILARGAPSVSIAIVKDDKIAYAQAYGDARLNPKTPARPEMRYKIGSNTKQITATAMLMLVDEGKVSLDDRVSRFFPELTRASEITIRQLLSHTSGYQDYYPLDYVAPFMARKTTAQNILDIWAKKPLDFDLGTKWQYSNTNYTIAGMIVERIAGKPLIEFLRARIFDPLGMRSPIDADLQPWSDSDPLGYTRNALGPRREAQPEGAGWLFSAGELAMTASDLARWDISLINGRLLKPESLNALTTEVHLKDGAGTGYALGLGVTNRPGHRKWAHGGGTSGFVSQNFTLPDEHIAVAVLTNQDDSSAQEISAKIEQILVGPPEDPEAASTLERMRKIFVDLQHGKLDRSLFTDDANAYFSPRVIADFSASLKRLGAPEGFRQVATELRGGMTYRHFRIRTRTKTLTLSTFIMPDAKVAQYLISAAPERE